MPLIAIGSQNRVKGQAILAAFAQMFPTESFELSFHAAPSGVSDQPMSDDETRMGAANRLSAVRAALPECDYWAAVEGGIEEGTTGMVGFAWVMICSRRITGQARTATFPLPTRLAECIRNGMELGLACDRLYETNDTKHRGGAIGLLSHNVVDRHQLYQHAALMALLPIKNPAWYPANPPGSS